MSEKTTKTEVDAGASASRTLTGPRTTTTTTITEKADVSRYETETGEERLARQRKEKEDARQASIDAAKELGDAESPA